MPSQTILSIDIRDRPGALGDLASALAAGGVNIDGFSVEGGTVHFLAKDMHRAQATIRAAGYEARAIPVFAVRLENRPGALAGLAGDLHEAGVEIVHTFSVTHGTTGTIYISVDDAEAARPALDKFKGARIAV